ncbi:MAG TPA: LptF/LptG family permease [Planctomycetota bacterium]|jgi:lipopolysaccharide export LptBFGC system permease protein LptF
MLRIFRARTLQRYVLREFAISFVLALAGCTLMMLLSVCFMKAQDYEEFGLTMGKVVLLCPYLLPRALAWAVPPAAMIAVTMVFGRLSAENEILAAQGGGAPLRVLAFPLILCGVLLSGFCLWCNQGGQRWGNDKICNEVLMINKDEFFANLEKTAQSVSLKLDAGGMVRINWLPVQTDTRSGVVRHPMHIAYFQNQEVGQTVLARDYVRHFEKGPGGTRVLVLTLKDAQVFGERQPSQQPVSGRSPEAGDMQSYCGEVTMEITLPAASKLLDFGQSRGDKGWMENRAHAVQIKNTYSGRDTFMLARAADFGASIVAGSPLDGAGPLLCGQSWSDVRIASEGMFEKGGALDRQRAENAECCRKLGLSFLPISTVILGLGLGLLVRKSQRLLGFLLGLAVYALLYYPLMIATRELANVAKFSLWIMFVPNLLLMLIGYSLWRAYERGWLETLAEIVASVGRILAIPYRLLVLLWQPVLALRRVGVKLFRTRTDGYVTGAFVGPLLVVLLAVAASIVALDLVYHGEEVLDGVLHAGEPLAGPIRSQFLAVLHVFAFYGISSLEMICDVLPLLLLVAGMLCVSTLVRNNEHLIFKASGIPLQRAFRPIIAATLLFSLCVTVVRETAMPSLIMFRDILKPMVYHRVASPTALAMHTVDNAGNPVLFQMSQYDSIKKQGAALRVYALNIDARMPVICGDRVWWDDDLKAWKLASDPPKTGPGSERKDLLPGKLINIHVEGLGKNPPVPAPPDIRPVHMEVSPISQWSGAITPSFLQCERLGSGVLSLDELWAASRVRPDRPDLQVDWWRRISEWTMGVFLLWMTIPLLVSEQRGPFVGVALSILVGAATWALNLGCASQAHAGVLREWAPVLPPAILFVLGSVHYYRRMQT